MESVDILFFPPFTAPLQEATAEMKNQQHQLLLLFRVSSRTKNPLKGSFRDLSFRAFISCRKMGGKNRKRTYHKLELTSDDVAKERKSEQCESSACAACKGNERETHLAILKKMDLKDAQCVASDNLRMFNTFAKKHLLSKLSLKSCLAIARTRAQQRRAPSSQQTSFCLTDVLEAFKAGRVKTVTVDTPNLGQVFIVEAPVNMACVVHNHGVTKIKYHGLTKKLFIGQSHYFGFAELEQCYLGPKHCALCADQMNTKQAQRGA